jgi:hypothetical protein
MFAREPLKAPGRSQVRLLSHRHHSGQVANEVRASGALCRFSKLSLRVILTIDMLSSLDIYPIINVILR